MATAVLVIMVFAFTDKRNSPPPAGLVPLCLFILILGIGACLGMETGYAIVSNHHSLSNPITPRLLSAFAANLHVLNKIGNFYTSSASFSAARPMCIQNPARDLGPRLLTSMVGYGKAVYTFRDQYWLWCPILAPICGAQVGAALYDSLLFTGAESIVNTP
jgi:aquaglyceroporin related protein, other eukaryote